VQDCTMLDMTALTWCYTGETIPAFSYLPLMNTAGTCDQTQCEVVVKMEGGRRWWGGENDREKENCKMEDDGEDENGRDISKSCELQVSSVAA